MLLGRGVIVRYVAVNILYCDIIIRSGDSE